MAVTRDAGATGSALARDRATRPCTLPWTGAVSLGVLVLAATGERARHVSITSRERRRLVRWLRRTANRAPSRDSILRRREILLLDRVAVARNDLLGTAVALERGANADASWVAELRALLTDGCKSPLCNPSVHVSELKATLW